MKLTGIICFAMAAGACLPASAQPSLAFRTGVNVSTARVRYQSDKIPATAYAGTQLALQLDMEFENKLRFAPFVALNNRGFAYKQVSDGSVMHSNNMYYIDLAPVLRYTLRSYENGNSFFVTGGPVMGVALYGKESIRSDKEIQKSRMNFDMARDYGYFDISLYGGIGYALGRLCFELSYLFGLNNINNNVEKDYKNIQNRSIGLHVGYRFHYYR
jgi:hypothetical protein